ncbi:MAG: hypothetical protein ACPGXZ_06045 [Saprospiraceae bacterium]
MGKTAIANDKQPNWFRSQLVEYKGFKTNLLAMLEVATTQIKLQALVSAKNEKGEVKLYDLFFQFEMSSTKQALKFIKNFNVDIATFHFKLMLEDAPFYDNMVVEDNLSYDETGAYIEGEKLIDFISSIKEKTELRRRVDNLYVVNNSFNELVNAALGKAKPISENLKQARAAHVRAIEDAARATERAFVKTFENEILIKERHTDKVEIKVVSLRNQGFEIRIKTDFKLKKEIIGELEIIEDVFVGSLLGKEKKHYNMLVLGNIKTVNQVTKTVCDLLEQYQEGLPKK